MNQGKETKEIENQPGLKSFNLNLSLTCNIYKHWHSPVHKVVNLIKCHTQIHTTVNLTPQMVADQIIKAALTYVAFA